MLLASADDVSQLVEIGRVLGTIASANAEVMLATPPQQLGLWRSARLGHKLCTGELPSCYSGLQEVECCEQAYL